MTTKRKGRPPNREPALAYDYRRAIALVQTIASGLPDGILALCEAWNVEPDWWSPDIREFDYKATVRLLAEACLQSAREETAGG